MPQSAQDAFEVLDSGSRANPGLEVNPVVIELTTLSQELLQIKDQLSSEFSLPNYLRATIEGRLAPLETDDLDPHLVPFLAAPPPGPRDEREELQFARVLCYHLYSSAEHWGHGTVRRAESAISHKHLREQVATTLRSIRDTLMIPALASLARPFQGRLNDQEQVSRADDETNKQWIQEVLDACGRAADQALILKQLSAQVYVSADNIREYERDLAAAARLSMTATAISNVVAKKSRMTVQEAVPTTPRWDASARSLFFGARLLKRYNRHSARNQTKVLSDFESAGWPSTLPSPVRGDQIRDTVRALNKAVGQKSPIRFSSDGTGNGISWTLTPSC